MPFCDCEHVLIDYDYVLQAPEYLNTAGIGDVLCGFAGIAEWRYNAARGTAPPVDEDAVEHTCPTTATWRTAFREPWIRMGISQRKASDSSRRRCRTGTTGTFRTPMRPAPTTRS